MVVNKFKRGQIWWYKTGDSIYETATSKTRPVIIMSNDFINENLNSMIGIPCTSQIKKPNNMHITFELNEQQSTALAENMMLIDKKKLGGYIGTCDSDLVNRLNNCMKNALGLGAPIWVQPTKPMKIEDYKEKVKEDILNSNENKKITSFDNKDIKSISIEKKSIKNEISQETEKPKRGRPKKEKYTKEYMEKFMYEYKTYDKEYMFRKYEFKTDRALVDKAYQFRKKLKELE